MKRKLIYVRWFDASFVTREWREGRELDDKGASCYVESSGFLIKATKAGIYIGADRDPDEPDRYRYISFVPKRNILKKKVITLEV